MNKTIAGIIVGVLVLGGAVYLTTRKPNEPKATTDTSTTTQNNQSAQATGRVVFSVTDAAMNMGTISAVNMEVSSVDAHSNTNGWVNVSNETRMYDLLLLNKNSQSALLVDTNVKAGTYDQIRMNVNSVMLTMKDGSKKTAKLPSNQLTMHTTLIVNADKTSHMNFDFIANESLHLTGNGTYIFAPVVKMDSKSNVDLEVLEDNSVQVNSGHVEENNQEGMDIDGEFKHNFHIDTNAKLNVDLNNNIVIN